MTVNYGHPAEELQLAVSEASVGLNSIFLLILLVLFVSPVDFLGDVMKNIVL